MADPPAKLGLTYHLGSALLVLFGLGAVGAAVVALFVEIELPPASTDRQWGRRHLKGPVREVVVEEITVSAAGDTSNTQVTERATYDRQGNRISLRRDTVHNTGGAPHSPDQESADTSHDIPTSINEYGFRLLTPEDVPWDSDSRLRFHYTFDFSNLYRYERFVIGDDGRLWRRYVHFDHPSGRTTSWTRFNRDGGFDGREVTTYNERGNYLEQKRYAADGSLDFHWTYAYNEQGDLIEMASLDEERIPRHKLVFVYEYDEWGNWTQRTTLRFAGGEGVESSFTARIITSRTISYYQP